MTPESYARTYMTLLRTSGDVRIRALEAAHLRTSPSLHGLASSASLDAGAFIYAIQRLPPCMAHVASVIVGQEGEQFRSELGDNVEDWERVESPARRRAWRWDGHGRLTVHASSPSDLDDVIPCLVAYQIEWNKLHDAIAAVAGARKSTRATSQPSMQQQEGEHGEAQAEASTSRDFNEDRSASADADAGRPAAPGVHGLNFASLAGTAGITPADWERLESIWGAGLADWLGLVAARRKDVAVRLLGGNDVAYARLARKWWQPIGSRVAAAGPRHRPLYLVSSNLHAIVNLVSGYVQRRRGMLLDFLEDAAPNGVARDEVEALRSLGSSANVENTLYYASRLWHQAHRDESLRVARRDEEAARGIVHVDATTGFDVGAQVIDLARLSPGDLDPRLAHHVHTLARTRAIVLNVDYPLGLASYHIVREVLTACPTVGGIYAIGKAATLNAAVGDVLLSDTVHDEHSGNTYSFPNAFRASDLTRFLDRASALDNQEAVTVRGTFLQNRESLGRYYEERFTVVEMEAGPILSAVYEATRPDRHPSGRRVHFRERELPFDFGIIHYASDTPYTQARTLGSRGLSVEGIDATYAAALAVLDRILHREGQMLRPR